MNKANIALAGVAALEAAWFLLNLGSIGFPDGFRTELDRFHMVAYPVAVALFVALAIAATRLRAKRVLVLLVALNVVVIAVEVYAAHVLDHGVGG